jgi:hypothetical protein
MAVAGVLLFTTAVTAISSRRREKKAERKAEELKQVELAQARDSAARERRQQIRQVRSAQAKIRNVEAASGESVGSAAIAAAANVQSQASENIGTINTTFATNVMKSELESDIFKLQQPSDLERTADFIGSAASIYGTSGKGKK